MTVYPFYTRLSTLKVPEQVLEGTPLGLGLVVKTNLLNLRIRSFLNDHPYVCAYMAQEY